MNLFRLLFVVFVCISFNGYTQSLGDDLEVSLLTCTSGNELYSTFGHSALRFRGTIDDTMTDEVYNYGTFEFGTTFATEMKFYYQFAKGQLDYKLSVDNFGYFQYEYIVTQRGITEQFLDLDANQKLALYQFMVNNAMPENSFYRYDFFYDNCSTRIRDVLQKVFGSGLIFKPNMQLVEDQTTFRDMIQLYLNDMPWSDFGIDIALGMPCDKKVSSGEEMFLPDFLMNNFDRATIDGRPLVKTKKVILEHEDLVQEESNATPFKIFWSLLLITIVMIVASFLTKKPFQYYFNSYFVITGVLGLLVFFLWFLTDHSTTKTNWNILWLMPLNLLVPFFGKKNWMKKYLMGYLLVLVLLLASFKWFPQAFHVDFIPLMLIMIIISIKRIWFTPDKPVKKVSTLRSLLTRSNRLSSVE